MLWKLWIFSVSILKYKLNMILSLIIKASVYITVITSVFLILAIFYIIFNFLMDCLYKIGKDYVKNPYYYVLANANILLFLFIYSVFFFIIFFLHLRLLVNLWVDYSYFVLPLDSDLLVKEGSNLYYFIMDPFLQEVFSKPQSNIQLDFIDQTNIIYGIPDVDYNWKVFYKDVTNNYVRNLSLYLDYKDDSILRDSVKFSLDYNPDNFYPRNFEDYVIPEEKEAYFFPPGGLPPEIMGFIYGGTSFWINNEESFFDWWITSVKQDTREMDHFYNLGWVAYSVSFEQFARDPLFEGYVEFCAAGKAGAAKECVSCKQK